MVEVKPLCIELSISGLCLTALKKTSKVQNGSLHGFEATLVIKLVLLPFSCMGMRPECTPP